MNVLGVVDVDGEPLRVHVEAREPRPVCPSCGGDVAIKERPLVELVDLGVFGRRACLMWRKHRWSCSPPACSLRSWTAEHPSIAAPRLGMTDRAGRRVSQQVGQLGRTVNEIALELNCDWHTINDTVLAYGTPLIEDPERIGEPTALGRAQLAVALLHGAL